MMPLPVVNRQRMQDKAVTSGDGGSRIGIEAAGEQDYG
jgi:hypothetical protein